MYAANSSKLLQSKTLHLIYNILIICMLRHVGHVGKTLTKQSHWFGLFVIFFNMVAKTFVF